VTSRGFDIWEHARCEIHCSALGQTRSSSAIPHNAIELARYPEWYPVKKWGRPRTVTVSRLEFPTGVDVADLWYASAEVKTQHMTKIVSMCVFMLITVGTCSPQENPIDGNWLLTSCQIALKHLDDPQTTLSYLDAVRIGYCEGITQGVGYVSPKVCTREDVTLVQAIRVVVKYLQDHPEELDQRNSPLVERALAKAFPCNK